MKAVSQNTRTLVLAAIIAALYTVLTLLLQPLAYGEVQIRFSEALTLLPILLPEAVPALAVGCLLSNILGGCTIFDIVFGTLATLLAAFLTSKCGKKCLAPLPPVVCNGLLVGGMLAWEQVGFTGAFGVAFLANGASVAAGEALACYGLGALLLWRLPRMAFFKNRMCRE